MTDRELTKRLTDIRRCGREGVGRIVGMSRTIELLTDVLVALRDDPKMPLRLLPVITKVLQGLEE